MGGKGGWDGHQVVGCCSEGSIYLLVSITFFFSFTRVELSKLLELVSG